MNKQTVSDITGHGKKSGSVKRIAPDIFTTYACTLLIIAGADGVISASEMNYLRNKLINLGASDEMLDKVQNFDWRNADLGSLILRLKAAGITGNWERALLYDAIKVAQADNDFDINEQIAIQKMAKLLGLDANVTHAISGVVEMEAVSSKVLHGLLEVQENS